MFWESGDPNTGHSNNGTIQIPDFKTAGCPPGRLNRASEKLENCPIFRSSE